MAVGEGGILQWFSGVGTSHSRRTLLSLWNQREKNNRLNRGITNENNVSLRRIFPMTNFHRDTSERLRDTVLNG